MILVIADDITGAAELGGIGLRYGLRVVLANDIPERIKTNLLVVYTNTRSLEKDEAVEVMEGLAAKAKTLQPSLFYKKTDSVLRGHVLAEITAQMNVLEMKRALLVPVNPLLERIIKDGYYYINGQLIHQTGFATDPEFPIRSSAVKDMLQSNELEVNVIPKKSSLPLNGIIVGEAESMEDVSDWAAYKNEEILFAGGASFFDALLKRMFVRTEKKENETLRSPILFISGTTYQKNVERIERLKKIVSYMPAEIFSSTAPSKEAFESWANKITKVLSEEGKAIVAIGTQHTDNADPNSLRENISEVVKRVFQKAIVGELLVEGGSTAYSIIQKLGWQSFTPTEELAQGVVRMKVEERNDLHITIKPGSYEWPAEWNFE